MSTIAMAAVHTLDRKYPQGSDVETNMKPYDWFKEPQFYIIGLIYMLSRLIGSISMSYIASMSNLHFYWGNSIMQPFR